MTRIYTRTGDKGETGLWGGARVPKSHSRIRALGDLDELNCALGSASAALPGSRRFDLLRRELEMVQGELLCVGTVLSAPAGAPPPEPAEGPPQGAAKRLETSIDRMTAETEPLTRFILPGGSAPGAGLHLARAVCRRAEREAVALRASEPVPAEAIVYLNRLSDYLFTAARWVNARLKRPEPEWAGAAAAPQARPGG